jgi:hypothetical protein
MGSSIAFSGPAGVFSSRCYTQTIYSGSAAPSNTNLQSRIFADVRVQGRQDPFGVLDRNGGRTVFFLLRLELAIFVQLLVSELLTQFELAEAVQEVRMNDVVLRLVESVPDLKITRVRDVR